MNDGNSGMTFTMLTVRTGLKLKISENPFANA